MITYSILFLNTNNNFKIFFDIEESKCEFSPEIKQYWVRNLPEVTKQCPPNLLLPSLLFKDSDFSTNSALPEENSFKLDVKEESVESDISRDKSNNAIRASESTNMMRAVAAQSEVEDRAQKLLREIEAAKEKYADLRLEFKKSEAKMDELCSLKEREDRALKELLVKVQLKAKISKVLEEKENLMKLRNMVQEAKSRMGELKKQWEDKRTPLLDEIGSLKTSLSTQELKMQEERAKADGIQEKHQQLLRELRDKANIERQLTEECSKLPRTTSRSAYTKRILEIIGNIKKQDEEIQKVLKDTKEVQKDISNLTGQLERSFTLADELIFRVRSNRETYSLEVID